LLTGCKKRKKIQKKQKHYGEKELKYIKMKKNFVSDLRKNKPSNFAIIYRYYRKDNKDISRIKK